MKEAVQLLGDFGIDAAYGVVSAHRTPDRMRDFARHARSDGLHAIIAGAGGAAHLPGMIASWTTLPVIGVPVESRALKGMDSLLSIVQMPGGVPVATMAIGTAGARNAALFAARGIATGDDAVHAKLEAWIRGRAEAALAEPLDG